MDITEYNALQIIYQTNTCYDNNTVSKLIICVDNGECECVYMYECGSR